MHLTIDAVEERATLSGSSASRTYEGRSLRKKQWVLLYAELALRRTSAEMADSFLAADQLKLVGCWSLKKVASIRGEMSRHLQNLARSGLGGAIEHRGKTLRWRLALSFGDISFLPSRAACGTWLRNQGLRFDDLGELERSHEEGIQWVAEMARGMIHLQQGRLHGAHVHISAAEKISHGSVLLSAVTELVKLRLLARRGEFPEELGPNLKRCEGSIGEALRIRSRLIQALEPDPDREEERIEELRRIVFKLESLPDVNGLGVAHNALAVRLRRQGRFDLASKSLRHAVALLIATFDLPSLQAAVFNLGHTLQETATTRGELEEALGLVVLDREIFTELGLGGDSAQAEIVAGLICLKLGMIHEAEKWLASGRKIAERLESDYNMAGVKLLRARVLWMKGLSSPQLAAGFRAEILREFEDAERLSRSAGLTGESIRREAACFRRAGQPPWLASGGWE